MAQDNQDMAKCFYCNGIFQMFVIKHHVKTIHPSKPIIFKTIKNNIKKEHFYEEAEESKPEIKDPFSDMVLGSIPNVDYIDNGDQLFHWLINVGYFDI